MNRQSPNNNRRVRWRQLLRWKNALNHDYKNNNGRNFQFTKFSFNDFVLTDRRRLQVYDSYRFDELLCKDFFKDFKTIFKESVSTGMISHFFNSHSKKAIPASTNDVIQPKDRIVCRA